MALNQAIEITPDQRDTLVSLLSRHLPNTEAWVYGSRVRGTSRPASDLDMVVFATPEQSCEMSELRESFEESNLPFRVDLFVWDEVPDSFRKQIERDHVVLTKPWRYNIADKEWKALPFPDVVFFQEGPGLRNWQYRDEGIPFLNIRCLINGRLDRAAMNCLDPQEVEAKYRHFLLDAGDYVVSSSGTIGRIAEVRHEDLPCMLNTSVIRMRPRDSNLLDRRFLRYFLASSAFQDQIRSYASGSVQVNYGPTHLKQMKIVVPPMPEQRAIARILGTLDDKIELNRRMNETLEAMARAIFKDWFVDFGPTRAKAEGRAPYLAPELWELFPDELDDEGKPIGWGQGTLADIVESPRRSVSPADVSDDTPYIGLEHMPRRSIALSDWEGAGKVKSNKTQFHRGEVLFGKLRPYFHKVGIAPLDGICSTDIIVAVPRTQEWGAFALACLSSDEFVDYTNRTSTGTKMPRTSWKMMAQYEVSLPPEQVVCAYQAVARLLLDRLCANIRETSALVQTRDLLLPKLMSGEVRLRDTEAVVAEVA